MANEIISRVRMRMEWISEISYGIAEYSNFVYGKDKEIPQDIKFKLTDCYDFDSVGYSIEEEAKELCKAAIAIMKHRICILVKKNIEDLEVLNLMTAETDEEKEEFYYENII